MCAESAPWFDVPPPKLKPHCYGPGPPLARPSRAQAGLDRHFWLACFAFVPIASMFVVNVVSFFCSSVYFPLYFHFLFFFGGRVAFRHLGCVMFLSWGGDTITHLLLAFG